MSILYIEPFSGASGDMFLGALCALADNYESIKQLPEHLGLKDAKVEVNEVSKNGISCKHVQVIDLGSGDGQKHRHLQEIFQIIDRGSITEKSKEIARSIFQIIGESESKIHNTPIDKIHFHELSGVDSIIDITGSAVLLDLLKVEKAYSSPLCTGFGKVKTQHGLLPIPTPATADILKSMPTYKGDEKGERLTPTGAAIIKYLNPEFNVPTISLSRIAYGPGEKDFSEPNVLRISLLEGIEKKGKEEEEEHLFMIESNIDDNSPEFLGTDFQDELMKNGAIDTYFTPINMKKGRPGLLISVLTSKKDLRKVGDFLLENTTSIGLRYYPVSRQILPRRSFNVETRLGNIQVKEVTTPSGMNRFKIEYESLKALSDKNKMGIQQIRAELMHIISNQKTGS